MLIALGVAVIVAAYGVHRLLVYAAGRGWVYYGDQRRPPGRGLGLLAPIYQPSLEHVVEEEASERVRRDQEESGDSPGAAAHVDAPDDRL